MNWFFLSPHLTWYNETKLKLDSLFKYMVLCLYKCYYSNSLAGHVRTFPQVLSKQVRYHIITMKLQWLTSDVTASWYSHLISTVQELNYKLTVLISKKVFVNVADSFLLQIHNANTVITGSLVNIQGHGSNNRINNIYIRCTQHQPSNQVH